MADNIHITGREVGGEPPGGASALEKMWRKFLRSPNLQNAQIFDVMLNNQFPQATNFIPTGKQRAVRAPQADSSLKEFNALQLSVARRAERDLNASQRAFKTGRISAASQLYQRGMYGVSESRHLSKLAQTSGLGNTGALRFLQTREKMLGSELGGSGGIPGKQLKILEQILSVLRKGGGNSAGMKGGAKSAGVRGKSSKLFGGMGGVLGIVEDTAALGVFDPLLAVGAVGAFIAKKGLQLYRSGYQLITPAMNTLIGASRVSRLLGVGVHRVESPLDLSGRSARRNRFYNNLGYSPQERLAIESSYGVTGRGVPLHLLATMGRSKYLGGLPTTDIAGMMGKLVGIGHIQATLASKVLNTVAAVSSKMDVNAGISTPAFMSMFGSVVSSNAPGVSARGLANFYNSFLAQGGLGARSGSMQNKISAGLQHMVANPNAVQLTLGEGLLFGGIDSMGGLLKNVHKYMGKGSVGYLKNVFRKHPLYKKDIAQDLKKYPVAAEQLLMWALSGDKQALKNLSLAEAKSIGLSSGLLPFAVSLTSGSGIPGALTMLTPGKKSPLKAARIDKKSMAGQAGAALKLAAQKAALSLEVSYKALEVFGPILGTANDIILNHLIPTIDELASAMKRLLNQMEDSGHHVPFATQVKRYSAFQDHGIPVWIREATSHAK